jgi:hypothetical protein
VTVDRTLAMILPSSFSRFLSALLGCLRRRRLGRGSGSVLALTYTRRR